ncbi:MULTISPECIES: STAS domain-containing protein [Chitinophagaceae]
MENFKLDTKEKFVVITPKTDLNTDITTEELRQLLEKQLLNTPKSVILNFEAITHIDPKTAETLAESSSQYMEAGASFVLCCVHPETKRLLNEMELVDILNITPTESEAWDIVQMEEIERELLSGEDEEGI